MATSGFGFRVARWALCAGAVALLGACAPSVEDVVATHRPAVEAKFALIQAIDASPWAVPPLQQDGVQAGGARIALDGEDSNALFLPAHSLSAPGNTSSDGWGATRAGTLETCGEALRGEFYGVARGAEAFLSECARAEYVFVLRAHEEIQPSVTGSDSFDGGYFEGDVLVFRLADATLLGGFRVSAENSDTVMASSDAMDVGSRLDSDISANLFVAIEDGLRTHVPGSID